MLFEAASNGIVAFWFRRRLIVRLVMGGGMFVGSVIASAFMSKPVPNARALAGRCPPGGRGSPMR
jgi:hypothetical protein